MSESLEVRDKSKTSLGEGVRAPGNRRREGDWSCHGRKREKGKVGVRKRERVEEKMYCRRPVWIDESDNM